MPKLKAFQILEEIAIDYLALAQDAKGRVNPMRRRRYKWLMEFVERLRKIGL
jgi:hypothetical protein